MMPCIEVSNFNGIVIGMVCGFIAGYFALGWRTASDAGVL
jgi:hypothetical protein